MKKSFFLGLSLLLFIGIINAQETVTKEQKVERDTKRMQTALSLTEEQTAKLQAFNISKHTGLEAVNADNTTTLDEKKMKRNQLQGKYQASLKSILTPSQKAMFAKMQEENRNKLKK